MHLAGYAVPILFVPTYQRLSAPLNLKPKKSPALRGFFLHSDDQSQLSAPPV